MFILNEFKKSIQIAPTNFDIPVHEAIRINVNENMAGKVVHNVGLIIALFDILNIGDMIVVPGDGSAYPYVHFRCIVFRPGMNEVITGNIKSCTPEGIQVSLEFFDDVLIPLAEIMRPSSFNDKDCNWIWVYEDEHQFTMNVGDKIRFRVVNECFTEIPPNNSDEACSSSFESSKAPYSIKGSINENGLGLLEWWT